MFFTCLIFLSAIISQIIFSFGVSLVTSVAIFFALCSLTFLLGFRSIRSYYLSPFPLATMFVNRLTGNHFDMPLPTHLSQHEANDLMTALNKLSQHLKGKEETLAKLEKMRIDFVANVSHELKTPLTSIKGYAETLRRGALEDVDSRDKFLDRIEANADRLNALISDLLALSRLEKTSNDLNWEVFDTEHFIEKLDSTFMPSLTRKKQSLNFDFKSPRLEGDRNKLEQVFTNLIDNAVRYTPEGSHFHVKQTTDDKFWYFEVSDNGPGISSEHLPRIFERFYRIASDRNRESGGTGLGLAIVKHAVAVHGGSINVESTIGKGTKFHIQIPRHSL